MRIAIITAGAGGMYCGSCLHDNTLAAALTELGHEVALIPTYTPIRTDEEDMSIEQVFFGGISVYLQEKFSLFRHTPKFVDNLLSKPALLNLMSKLASATNAKDLGRLTVSMLQGEHGHQKKELYKLVDWLKTSYKPDIVQLPNSMFIGFAHAIKSELGVPVLCAMQGEDLFLDELIEPYRSEALSLLRQHAKNADGFISNSDYYAGFMAEYLAVDRDKIDTVRLGIKLSGHGDQELRVKDDESRVVGYLARICPEKGLHILIQAFHRLHKIYGSGNVQLKIAGYLSKKDQSFFDEQMQKIEAWGLAEDVEYVGEVDRLGKIVFLNNLDVLSVPTVYHEPKGIFVLEAMANGIPVVLPEHGAFPEFIRESGGGTLVQPDNPDALAAGIQSLLDDAALREQVGQKARSAVTTKFNEKTMATATAELYKKYL
jgi:glycosyltransferase involved in cell wall biosynthesis